MSDRSSSAPREVLVLLVGGTAGAVSLATLGVPAGGIIGAVLGSALARMVRDVSVPTKSLRIPGLVLLGIAAGLRLDGQTLRQLAELAVPLGVSIVVLLAVQYLLAWFLVARFAVDPVTAMLATAPGGVSEIASMADELGARAGLVTAIHVVRVIVVVVVVLPLLLRILA